ncbi:MAG: polyhydroxyalkanoic acid system family protein [Polyangiaceae bacterium]
MSTIDISKSHTLSKADARLKAEELARSMEQKIGIEWKWDGDSIAFNAPSGVAKGTKGHVEVTDKTVRVTVELPLMLRVMKGTIESKIHEKLDVLT